MICIIRFIFLNDERNSYVLKNLNKSEEEKISLIENSISEVNLENHQVEKYPRIVNFYPNSKSEILEIIINRICIFYYLGNTFFSILTLSILMNKYFELEGDLFPTFSGVTSLSKNLIFNYL